MQIEGKILTIKNSALLCILALTLTLQACGGGGGSSVGGTTDGGATDGGATDGGPRKGRNLT